MKTLLIPTDFSECALQAIKTSIPIAITTGAKIILLHNVYTETKWETLPTSKKLEYPETLAKVREAEIKMNLLMKTNLFRKVSVSNVITFGVASEEITLRARQRKADLIIMGTHGNDPSDRYFIGSTIQKVLREAGCPVMTVPKKFKPSAWKKLVFATDFDKDTYKPFEKIKGLALDLKATVYLLFVNRPTTFLDTRAIHLLMDSFVMRYPELKFHKVIYNHEEAVDGILQFVEDNPMDWIALVTRKRSLKPKYLIGHTETLAFRAGIPIVSITVPGVPLK